MERTLLLAGRGYLPRTTTRSSRLTRGPAWFPQPDLGRRLTQLAFKVSGQPARKRRESKFSLFRQFEPAPRSCSGPLTGGSQAQSGLKLLALRVDAYTGTSRVPVSIPSRLLRIASRRKWRLMGGSPTGADRVGRLLAADAPGFCRAAAPLLKEGLARVGVQFLYTLLTGVSAALLIPRWPRWKTMLAIARALMEKGAAAGRETGTADLELDGAGKPARSKTP